METALQSEDSTKRFIYLDRRVCSVTPGRIDVHPARSIIILPLLTLLLGLAAFPVIFFGGSSLSVELRFGLTLLALFLVPLSGLGVVYSIAGAHVVVERHKQSAVLQQGYLGMGVGTQELDPVLEDRPDRRRRHDAGRHRVRPVRDRHPQAQRARHGRHRYDASCRPRPRACRAPMRSRR